MTTTRQLLVVATCALSVGCGLIAGVLDVPVPADGGAEDGAPRTEAGGSGGHDAAHDSQGARGPDASPDGGDGMKDGATGKPDSGTDATTVDTGAKSDASDAARIPDGYVQCALSANSCDLAGGQECCLTVIGTIGTVEAGYDTTQTNCEAIGGPNCGSFASEGTNFQELFPQTCASASDCAQGDICCAFIPDGGTGDPPMIGSIGCTSPSMCGGTILCKKNSDCPNVCVAETDPFLVHLWTRRCSP